MKQQPIRLELMLLPKSIPYPLVLCSALAMLAGCSHESGDPTGGPIPKPKGAGLPVPVLAAAAVQKDFPIELTAIGNARAFASVAVKARVDGQLSSIHFKQGQEVKQGATMFEVDPRPFQAILAQVQAILERDEASLRNAEVDMRRTDDLATTRAVSASLVDANRAKVASLRATVAADQAAVDTAKLQLSFCTVASPVNGRIGLLEVDPGNMVRNNDTILAVVNQIRPIYVDFAVPERLLSAARSAIAAGHAQVQARIPDASGPPVVGELSVVDNQVDVTTGTVMLRAVFPNEDEQLWPGQFLNIAMDVGRISNAIVVPSQALQVSQEGEFVFVVAADFTVEKRMVKSGPMRDGETVIEQGLRSGETVVTDGQLRLVPGAKVDVKQPAPASPAEPADGRPA
jgi:multidrug efflux system membrane fusion protein